MYLRWNEFDPPSKELPFSTLLPPLPFHFVFSKPLLVSVMTDETSTALLHGRFVDYFEDHVYALFWGD